MTAKNDHTPSGADSAPDKLRLDRWLFFSRLVKSRSLAAKLIETGHVRVNGEKTHQAKRAVGPSDVLTITLPHDRLSAVKIIKLVACGTRRGPASEAQTLYEDMTPPPPPKEDKEVAASRFAPSPGRRPTKHERQGLQRMKRQSLPEQEQDED
ncbi:MAG: RNA-binding S4 domain-containing protein [Hyphomicrobiales bacterium]